MAATAEKSQYDNVAPVYTTYESLPHAKIEAQLVQAGLGDCTGLKILDLGGGVGLRARDALDQGAEMVDIVDVSPGMLERGKEIDEKAGKKPNLRWFLADAAKDVWEQQKGKDNPYELLPPGGYDLVMANWVVDHAHSVEDLTGMWKNIAAAMKPGGRFVGIRCMEQGIWADFSLKGKYGARFEKFKGPEGPGGVVVCDVVITTNPPFSFEAQMVADSYKNINAIPKSMGMVDFEMVPLEEMAVIKSDPAFWEELVKEPQFAVIKARKAA